MPLFWPIFADAILLAVCGGLKLLRTQKAYFERRTTALPYLRLFQSIVTNDLSDIVQNADLQEWKEIKGRRVCESR
jgi:protein transport protein SEC31